MQITDQNPDNLIFGDATTRHANFMKFCFINNIDVRNTDNENLDRYLTDCLDDLRR